MHRHKQDAIRLTASRRRTSIVLGVVLYVATLRLLGGLDEAERRRILQLKLPFKRVLERVL